MGMQTILFQGRHPTPEILKTAMQGEHNAEVLMFEGLPEFDAEQVTILNYLMPDGTSIDLLTITPEGVLITRTHTAQPGVARGWVTIQVGTELVWKSEEFYLNISELPDASDIVEHQYPTALEEALAQMQEYSENIENAITEASASAEETQEYLDI